MFMTVREDGTKTDLKRKALAVVEAFRFVTTERYTVEEVSIFLFCFPPCSALELLHLLQCIAAYF